MFTVGAKPDCFDTLRCVCAGTHAAAAAETKDLSRSPLPPFLVMSKKAEERGARQTTEVVALLLLADLLLLSLLRYFCFIMLPP